MSLNLQHIMNPIYNTIDKILYFNVIIFKPCWSIIRRLTGGGGGLGVSHNKTRH